MCVLSKLIMQWCLHFVLSLQWRHDERDGVSNHQPHNCLLNRLFKRKSKKTSKLCVTGLNEGNSPVTGEFPAQRASNAENVSIWRRHHIGIRSHRGQWTIYPVLAIGKAVWCILFNVFSVKTQPCWSTMLIHKRYDGVFLHFCRGQSDLICTLHDYVFCTGVTIDTKFMLKPAVLRWK